MENIELDEILGLTLDDVSLKYGNAIEHAVQENDNYGICDICRTVCQQSELLSVDNPEDFKYDLMRHKYYSENGHHSVCKGCDCTMSVDQCCCCGKVFDESEISYYRDIMDYEHISVCEYMRTHTHDSCICNKCIADITDKNSAIRIFYKINIDNYIEMYQYTQDPISIIYLGSIFNDDKKSPEDNILFKLYLDFGDIFISRNLYDKYDGNYIELSKNENAVFINKIEY